MATTIKLKNSVTTTNAPSSLVQGEVAINITDKKVWVGNAATTPIQLLGDGGSASFTSIAFGAGTVSNPSITFTGDTNTGIYSPAADTIAFTEGGVEAMRIDSSGRLLVGGTAADGILTLGNSGWGTSAIWQSTRNNGNVIIFGVESSTGGSLVSGSNTGYAAVLNSQNAYPLVFGTNNTERMRIDSSGNVGIGTNNPSQKVEINDATTAAEWNGLRVISAANPSGTSYTYINIEKGSGFGGAIAGYLQQGVGSGLAFFSNNGGTRSERMRIDSSGNVLIGTTTSGSYKLNVKSDIGIGAAANGTAALYFNGAIGGDSISAGSFIQGTYTAYGTNSAGALIFGTNPNTTGAVERMRITSGGNVGIGTSTVDVPSGFSRFVAIGDSDTGIGQISDGILAFSTNLVERMRITSGGSLLVNATTGTDFKMRVSGSNAATFGDDYDSTVYGAVQIIRPANQGTAFHLSFIRGGQQVAGMGFLNNSSTFAILNASNNSGAGVTLTNGATSWGTTSDERKKDIIAPVENALTKLANWRSVYYKYKIDDADAPQRVGLIAQDVHATLPEAISVEEDEIKTLQLRYTETIPLLVKAIQEMKAIIDEQAATISALESK